MPTDARVQELARLLDVEPHEVLEMLADDERIDKGEKLFELDPEHQKASKKARAVNRSPNSKPSKRERKTDNEKQDLIHFIGDCLHAHQCDDIVETNPERQIDFVYNGRKFRIVLSAPRT